MNGGLGAANRWDIVFSSASVTHPLLAPPFSTCPAPSTQLQVRLHKKGQPQTQQLLLPRQQPPPLLAP